MSRENIEFWRNQSKIEYNKALKNNEKNPNLNSYYQYCLSHIERIQKDQLLIKNKNTKT